MTHSAMRLAALGAASLTLGGLAASPGMAQEKHLTITAIPSATVAPMGTFFLDLSGTTEARVGTDVDGSMSFGYGFGNAETGIGVQSTATITSLTERSDDGFGESGYISLKFSKRLGVAPVYAGLQVDHLANWGEGGYRYVTETVDFGEGGLQDVVVRERITPSVRLMLTGFQVVEARNTTFPLMWTIGIGNRVRDAETEPGLFGGVGVGLTENLAASFDWNGDYFDLGLGAQLAHSLYVNATLNDAFDMEDRQRVTVSVSYTFKGGF